MNNEETTINTETLSDKVKAFRIEARNIARMKMINNRLQDIYQLKQTVETAKKSILANQKAVMIYVYEQNKAYDENHPDAEQMKKDLDQRLKSMVETVDSSIKYYKEEIKKLTEEITKKEEEIKEIEEGNIKVNISEINELTKQMIYKI